jgi:hypothetical protein
MFELVKRRVAEVVSRVGQEWKVPDLDRVAVEAVPNERGRRLGVGCAVRNAGSWVWRELASEMASQAPQFPGLRLSNCADRFGAQTPPATRVNAIFHRK